MRPAPLLWLLLGAAAVALGACGSGERGGEAAGPSSSTTTAVDPDAEALTVSDSCGESFTVRDEAGTMRLTIAPTAETTAGAEPGSFALGDGGWTGWFEVGSGLAVWPCHDIGTDFDDEQVDDVWPVVGGTVELLDPIVADVGGGGSGPVRADLQEVVIERPDATTVSLGGIRLENPRWGFSGG
ncbi:MAG: hypothetical protein ACLFWR_00960 [Acidimicrobiales bacterium]